MALAQAQQVFSDASNILFNTPAQLNEQGMARLELREEWLPYINFCYLEPSDSLLIFADCGQVPADRELEIFRELLNHQFLFDKSNGITFALAPEDNALTVQYLSAVSTLDGNSLVEILIDFVQEVSKVRLKVMDQDKEADRPFSFAAPARNSKMPLGDLV
ncbi:MAG: type III secretion system chaperone [Succinivibrio sp.]|nr:type III secretion system chaperone [Succinivibrio sp.]